MNYQCRFTVEKRNGHYDIQKNESTINDETSFVTLLSSKCFGQNKWDEEPPKYIQESQIKKYYENGNGNLEFFASATVDCSKEKNALSNLFVVSLSKEERIDQHYTINIHGVIWQEKSKPTTHAKIDAWI